MPGGTGRTRRIEEAERRLGELIQKQKETVGLQQGARGAPGPGRGKNGVPQGNPVSDPRPTLGDVGIDAPVLAPGEAAEFCRVIPRICLRWPPAPSGRAQITLPDHLAAMWVRSPRRRRRCGCHIAAACCSRCHPHPPPQGVTSGWRQPAVEQCPLRSGGPYHATGHPGIAARHGPVTRPCILGGCPVPVVPRAY